MRFQQNLLLQKQQAEQETLEEEFRSILQQTSQIISEDYEHIRDIYNPLRRSAARIEKAHSEQIFEKGESKSMINNHIIGVKSRSPIMTQSSSSSSPRESMTFDSPNVGH